MPPKTGTDAPHTPDRPPAAVTGTPSRPESRRLLDAALRRSLRYGGRVWIAEIDGIAVGVANGGWARPVAGSSIEHRLRDGRWGYVRTLSVAAHARGTGVGKALMAVAHRELDDGDVCGTYLYFNPANPRSSVFWPRQGYRPLWMSCEARPAAALR
jgi:GNAT superfamily N-acetyltransferase